MSSSSSMISFINLKSSTNSKTNNKDPPSVKKERDIRLESGMEGDRHEVAVHSPARNHGNSVRKFWSNGSRPGLTSSSQLRVGRGTRAHTRLEIEPRSAGKTFLFLEKMSTKNLQPTPKMISKSSVPIDLFIAGCVENLGTDPGLKLQTHN